jgi:predicted DNA-binding protein (MmcQ/YjbR family)
MVFDVSKITGIGPYTIKSEPDREIYLKDESAFLVLHRNTIEVRCDTRLSDNLKEKYESVMESRYYGKGGIEIVLAGQLTPNEIEDLIRLSYNLTV